MTPVFIPIVVPQSTGPMSDAYDVAMLGVFAGLICSLLISYGVKLFRRYALKRNQGYWSNETWVDYTGYAFIAWVAGLLLALTAAFALRVVS